MVMNAKAELFPAYDTYAYVLGRPRFTIVYVYMGFMFSGLRLRVK